MNVKRKSAYVPTGKYDLTKVEAKDFKTSDKMPTGIYYSTLDCIGDAVTSISFDITLYFTNVIKDKNDSLAIYK